MDAAYIFAHLARRLSDYQTIVRYRAQQTTEVIEESLFVWRDAQARDFAVAIDEPQRSAFEPLRDALRNVYECLEALESQGHDFDIEAGRILSSQQAIHDDCASIEKSLDQARRHTEDCLDQASASIRVAKDLKSQIKLLGQPPV